MVQGILIPFRRIGNDHEITFNLHMVASKIIREKKKYV